MYIYASYNERRAYFFQLLIYVIDLQISQVAQRLKSKFYLKKVFSTELKFHLATLLDVCLTKKRIRTDRYLKLLSVVNSL